jgi:hypothetical protein
MKKRSLILKIIAIANALSITAAFVGCPARKDPAIVTIAPYGGNFQHFLPSDQTPPPTSQYSKNDKRSP